jgi:hypothetical protein
LYRAGAMIELLKEVAKHEVDVCALQEIIRKNYMIVYSRNKSDKQDFVLVDVLQMIYLIFNL